MNKLYYLLIAFLILILILLSNGIFFGDNSYSKRAELLEDNKIQEIKNEELKRQNKILEFEIKNAQNSNDHIENFAREKLNLTYQDEEFIYFKKENNRDDKDE